MKNMNDVYHYIAKQEGLKKQLSIGQVKELMRIVVDMLLLHPELAEPMLTKYAKNRKAKLKREGKL